MKNQTEKQQNLTAQTDVDPPAPSVIDPEALTLLQAENAELRATINLGSAREQITSELTKAGARSPSLLFDAAMSELQFADDGSLSNAAALVGSLRTKFPEQFGIDRPNASIDAGAGRVNAPSLTKESLAAMKPSEIANLDWADVRNVLSA